jgi:glycosyltransferase involved in cell wall biosynthesis
MNRAARFAPRGAWVLAGRLGGYYDLGYYRRCDHLIGNTRALVRWMVAEGWPAARAHYLPNFAPDLAGAPPERLTVPPGAPLVLALGRLHRNKAFDVLIRALPRLPGVHAIIAGDGPERPALAALARAEGVADRLHLPGWRHDTGALLAGCDVLACPSRHEPLGNVVVEAFAAGRPVVAAGAAGPRELITPGEDGLLVPVEDAPALATSLGLVLGTPAFAARLAAAGRARYEAEFAEAPVLAQWRRFLSTAEHA